MSEDQFHQSLDAFYSSGRNFSCSFLAVTYFVTAIGEKSDDAFGKGSSLLHKVFAEGTATSVQAVILAVLYKQSMNERNLAWLLLGAGIRISQSLALHLPNKRNPQDSHHQLQWKRRLWYSIYELEQVLACSLGRPSGIVGISSAEVPIQALGTYGNEYTPPGYCVATATFARVLHNIRDRIYTSSEDQAPSEQTIGELIQEVEKWWDAVPAHLKATDTMPPSQARAVCCLGLRYNYALILLTRPHLLYSVTHSDGWPPEILERVRVCETASNQSVTILLEMARRDVLSDSVWFDTDYIICTGIVLFLRGLRTPADDVLAKARDLMPLLEMTRKSFLGNYTFETLSGLLNDLDFREFNIVPQE
ncbi:hypothetical protein SLS56_009904 [Neofusicoccum ribis]|uniref:Xylanolytic transcriptional activator regulatory domain-containing protein n=1 Tax=Neofusicoccum ribis TaxID=45134 RepID=A0ABR3SG06_9PEZI